MADKKKIAAGAAGGLAAVFAAVVFHPIVLPALAVGGAYAAIKATSKNDGPKQ
jgi:hypothetical protein